MGVLAPVSADMKTQNPPLPQKRTQFFSTRFQLYYHMGVFTPKITTFATQTNLLSTTFRAGTPTQHLTVVVPKYGQSTV
jgi:hypothetical protein